jgi:protein subunit release factor A
MEVEDVKAEIKKNIKWGMKESETKGGQQCGLVSVPIVLTSEDLCLSITIGFHRSQIKNKELALVLFELALDELIK